MSSSSSCSSWKRDSLSPINFHAMLLSLYLFSIVAKIANIWVKMRMTLKDLPLVSLKQAAQYIGEICRYLLSMPDKPHDTGHSVRLMFGNGLRPQIWPQFVARFNIQDIGEVYGSTEGNSNLGLLNDYLLIERDFKGFLFLLFLQPISTIRWELLDFFQSMRHFCILLH